MSTRAYLGNRFSENNFIIFCSKLLKNINQKGKNIDILSQYQGYIKDCKFIADFKDSNNKKIAIMTVKIADDSNARTTQRNFVAHVLSNGELFGYDGALVAYYDDSRSNWKLALVTIDYDLTDKGIKMSFQPAKRFSFLVGEGEPSKTYNAQLKPIFEDNNPPTYDELREAFSVGKVTKDFYSDYCDCFNNLVEFLVSSKGFISEANRLEYKDDDKVKEFAITFSKKTLGQIVFLHFIQKKGWLGVPLDSQWGFGDNEYIVNTTKNYFGDNYFNDVLEPLFYNALNKKRHNDLYNGVKIPFLNGGLFSPIQDYDWNKTNFNIPNDIWFNKNKNGFLDILSQYNFTVDESDPTEQDIAVDPEMLGKIFESLLDPEDRHSKGAHYTPREIVHFMCIESIAYNLSINCNIDFILIKNYLLYGNALDDKEEIIKRAKEIDEYIINIKIVDPAVGSGAFLVGMLNEIVRLRLNLNELLNNELDKYLVKKSTIKNSLFGVDIEFDAIEIAKLRLWLSLIVDQNIINDSTPEPLPNLTFKLRVGNSLIDEYCGVKLWDYTWAKKHQSKELTKDGFGNIVVNTNKAYIRQSFFESTVDYLLKNLKATKEKYMTCSNEEDKNILYKEIEKCQIELIKEKLTEDNNLNILKQLEELLKKNSKPFFLWDFEFQDIFDDGGFDIVIANPPYIQLQLNEGKLADELEPLGYETFARMGDIYCLFYEQAMNLLKNKGISCFITSNKWMRAGYGEKLRGYLAKKTNPLLLVDFAGTKVFESATVDVNILISSKEENKLSTKTCIFDGKSTDELSVFVEQDNNKEKFSSSSNWIILNSIEKSIKTKICMNSISLAETGIKINYGIKTGANEAFIIDEGLKNHLISLDKKNAEIIRPLIRGRDVKRFNVTSPGLYLINVHNGIPNTGLKPVNINDYPSIKAFMDNFYNQLVNRKDQGITPYNLRSCSYLDDFYMPKIIYPETTQHANFYFDKDGIFIDKTCFMMLTDFPYYITSTLASMLFEYAYKRLFSSIELGKNGYQYNKHALLKLPIIPPTIELEKKFKTLNFDYDKINSAINNLYNLNEEEIIYIKDNISQ